MFTVDALVAHAVGDYVLQSDWMATEKVRRSTAAIAHAVAYTFPFLFLTRDPRALVVICSTHFVIDRWRLARYVCWVKNYLAPRHRMPEESHRVTARNWSWAESSATGYGPDKPAWMAVWLLIITDNLMHVSINAVALRWWP